MVVDATQTPLYIRTSAGLTRVVAPLGSVQSGVAGRGGTGSAMAAPSASAAPTLAARAGDRTPVAGLDLGEDDGLHSSSAASAPEKPAEPSATVLEYEVRPGDTLSTVARRFGITTATMRAANDLVTDPDVLKVGQKLWVPTRDGVLYFVRLGDTITDIAKEHQAKPEDIITFGPNRIPNADSIREGDLILIVGGTRPAPPPPPPTPVPTPAPRPVTASGAPAAAPAQPPVARSSGSGWIWPITGPLSSYFGPSHPLGIDVDLFGRAGAPIVASRAGVVTFAGGNPCCSYGYYVEIDHGDGFRTIYAHFNSPPPVSIGQRVAQGQVIGYAGTTGYSTGVHLHFEVRKGGVPVNPLGYLP